MSVKMEVLKLLETHREEDISGQEIAECLGVTRSAVWKAVNALKKDGYLVDAANKRGYRLKTGCDILSAEGIYPSLYEKYRNREIVVCRQVDSTNQEVKRRALEGATEGLAVLAEEQTAGRGRRGRSFFSPSQSGIYMSVLFRPGEEQAEQIVLITTAAAVAVCRAIRRLLPVDPKIKWVNDVYLNNKKICGILTEAISDFESGRIDTVVVGIGINYYVPEQGYPDEIKKVADAICADGFLVPRNRLAAAVLNELYDLYENLADRSFMEDYRAWSDVLGREVRFTEGRTETGEEKWVRGKAVDIDDNGALIVQLSRGKKVALRTGEITLRLNKSSKK